MATIQMFGRYKHKSILVDNRDYDYLNQSRWFNRKGYAYKWDKNKCVAMHRIIMKAKSGEYLDHINGNKLDNRKSNLRFATYQQNLCNRPKQRNNTSGFKGVTKHNIGKGYWRARISVNGVEKHLGLFDTREEAANSYQQAAKVYHKEFAWGGGYSNGN